MSEKIIDIAALRKLLNPQIDNKARKLIEQRFQQEQEDEDREYAQRTMTMGAPALPDAQLVYNHEKGTVGVAVRKAKFICDLPQGYTGKGLELAVIEGNRLIAIHPDHPPLLINPADGTTRRL
jgi:hypothetical protein